jgi:putative heme-binding domain-containing protein
MVHYVQGGYFIKGFAKHGPLSNPYSFGYFDHVPHAGWRGGHVTQLGVVYQGGALPEKYNGTWIAPNLLANNVDYHAIETAGSTFKTKLLGEFLGSADKCFRPVDIRTGPDGAIYIADWYDVRANHVIPQDTWDKGSGRVYRVAPKGLPGVKPFDLSKMSGRELWMLLHQKNDWYVRMVLRVFAERRDVPWVQLLPRAVRQSTGRDALEALWVLNAGGGFNEAVAAELLDHPTADVRAWTVRLLGDEKSVSASTASKLAEVAKSEGDVTVRAQLACSARRLPAEQGLPIVFALMSHDEDADDRYIPLLLWWAIEDKATTAREEVVTLFLKESSGQKALARRHLLERLARRYAAEPTDANLESLAQLLQLARRPDIAKILVAGMDKGFAGKAFKEPPARIAAEVSRLWASSNQTVPLVSVATRLGVPAAVELAREQILSKERKPADRVALIETWADAGPDAKILLSCLDPQHPKEVRAAALAALQRFPDADVGAEVLRRYAGFPKDLRPRAITLLSSRSGWAAALLESIGTGTVDRKDLPPDQVRRLALHGDAQLDALTAKVFGAAKRDTPEEKKAAIARFKAVLAGGDGEAASGKAVYVAACGQCHALHGEGTRIGPDLTGYDRRDLDFMLGSIVDPSAAIRPEFAAYVVQTTDGRVLNGPIVASGPETVTIEDGQARITVARPQIKRLAESPVSRMPEGLLDALTPQQVRDLFTFMATEGPQPAK